MNAAMLAVRVSLLVIFGFGVLALFGAIAWEPVLLLQWVWSVLRHAWWVILILVLAFSFGRSETDAERFEEWYVNRQAQMNAELIDMLECARSYPFGSKEQAAVMKEYLRREKERDEWTERQIKKLVSLK